MKRIGTDTANSFPATAFSTLDNANQRLDQALSREQQSADRRAQIASNTIQTISKQSQVEADAAVQQANAEGIQKQRTIARDNTPGSGSFGKVFESIANAAGVYMQVEQKDKELDFVERQLVVKQDAEKAKQYNEFKLAEHKTFQDEQFTQAEKELREHQLNYASGDRFRKDGIGLYRSEGINIMSKYDVSEENRRALADIVYDGAKTELDANIKRQVDYADKVSVQTTDVIVAQSMATAAGAMSQLKSPDFNIASAGRERLNNIASELMQREDIDELTKMTVLNSLYTQAATNTTTGTELSDRIVQDGKAVVDFAGQVGYANQMVAAGQWSATQREYYLDSKRIELNVPAGVKTTPYNYDAQQAYDVIKTQDNINQLQRQNAIESSKAQQLTNDAIGYLAYNIIQNPKIINQLKIDSVVSANPGVQTAIGLVEQYERVKIDNNKLALQKIKVQEQLAALEHKGVQHWISQAQKSNDPSLSSVLAQLQGLPVPQGGSDTMTPEMSAAYQQTHTGIRNALIAQGLEYDRQIQQNLDPLRPYGLADDPNIMKQIMPQRKSTYEREIELLNQRAQQATQPQQLGMQGTSSPFNNGGGAGSNRSQYVDAQGYVVDGSGNRKAQALMTTKVGNNQVVLPFKPGAPVSGAAAKEYKEKRPSHTHAGEDIQAPNGTHMVSYVGGKVLYAGWNDGGYGYMVDILGDDGMVHRFAHLQDGSIRVKKGQYIEAGTHFGNVGSTGRSSGPHLHWEIRADYTKDSKKMWGVAHTVDPLGYMASQQWVASTVKRPTGNQQGWTVSNDNPQSVPRVPKGALSLPGGAYILNGKLGNVNVPSAGVKPHNYNTGNPVSAGYESNNAKSYTNKKDANYGYAALAQDKAFAKDVAAMCDRLGVPAQWVVDVMAYETQNTFSTGIANQAGSGATGLIQFMPATAQGLGTSTAALARMTRRQQLAYVEKYFKSFGADLKLGVEYVLAAVWGGNGLVQKLKKGGNVSGVSDGNITFGEYVNKLGNAVGRQYDTRWNRRAKLTSTTHVAFNDGCKMCSQLQASGSGIIPHKSQMA